MTFDLHCHSTFSDGFLTPSQLVELAIQNKIEGLSITDHDTVGAYSEFKEESLKKGLRFISGIEFSSILNQTPIHILGYSFKLNHPKILDLTLYHKERRKERNQQILNQLSKLGIHLTLDEIYQTLPHMKHQVGRAHIAFCLFKKGYVTSPQEAFQLWIGENKSCFVSSTHPSIHETIEAIHAANGFAVIAHPHLINHKATFKALLDFKFDGIEAKYALFKFSANQRFIDIAKSKNWIITGGSDFHGEIRPQNPIASSSTDKETFLLLENRFLENL